MRENQETKKIITKTGRIGLTFRGCSGILNKLSGASDETPESDEEVKTLNLQEKTLKKCLTKSELCGKVKITAENGVYLVN